MEREIKHRLNVRVFHKVKENGKDTFLDTFNRSFLLPVPGDFTIGELKAKAQDSLKRWTGCHVEVIELQTADGAALDVDDEVRDCFSTAKEAGGDPNLRTVHVIREPPSKEEEARKEREGTLTRDGTTDMRLVGEREVTSYRQKENRARYAHLSPHAGRILDSDQPIPSSEDGFGEQALAAAPDPQSSRKRKRGSEHSSQPIPSRRMNSIEITSSQPLARVLSPTPKSEDDSPSISRHAPRAASPVSAETQPQNGVVVPDSQVSAAIERPLSKSPSFTRLSERQANSEAFRRTSRDLPDVWDPATEAVPSTADRLTPSSAKWTVEKHDAEHACQATSSSRSVGPTALNPSMNGHDATFLQRHMQRMESARYANSTESLIGSEASQRVRSSSYEGTPTTDDAMSIAPDELRGRNGDNMASIRESESLATDPMEVDQPNSEVNPQLPKTPGGTQAFVGREDGFLSQDSTQGHEGHVASQRIQVLLPKPILKKPSPLHSKQTSSQSVQNSASQNLRRPSVGFAESPSLSDTQPKLTEPELATKTARKTGKGRPLSKKGRTAGKTLDDANTGKATIVESQTSSLEKGKSLGEQPNHNSSEESSDESSDSTEGPHPRSPMRIAPSASMPSQSLSSTTVTKPATPHQNKTAKPASKKPTGLQSDYYKALFAASAQKIPTPSSNVGPLNEKAKASESKTPSKTDGKKGSRKPPSTLKAANGVKPSSEPAKLVETAKSIKSDSGRGNSSTKASAISREPLSAKKTTPRSASTRQKSGKTPSHSPVEGTEDMTKSGLKTPASGDVIKAVTPKAAVTGPGDRKGKGQAKSNSKDNLDTSNAATKAHISPTGNLSKDSGVASGSKIEAVQKPSVLNMNVPPKSTSHPVEVTSGSETSSSASDDASEIPARRPTVESPSQSPARVIDEDGINDNGRGDEENMSPEDDSDSEEDRVGKLDHILSPLGAVSDNRAPIPSQAATSTLKNKGTEHGTAKGLAVLIEKRASGENSQDKGPTKKPRLTPPALRDDALAYQSKGQPIRATSYLPLIGAGNSSSEEEAPLPKLPEQRSVSSRVKPPAPPAEDSSSAVSSASSEYPIPRDDAMVELQGAAHSSLRATTSSALLSTRDRVDSQLQSESGEAINSQERNDARTEVSPPRAVGTSTSARGRRAARGGTRSTGRGGQKSGVGLNAVDRVVGAAPKAAPRGLQKLIKEKETKSSNAARTASHDGQARRSQDDVKSFLGQSAASNEESAQLQAPDEDSEDAEDSDSDDNSSDDDDDGQDQTKAKASMRKKQRTAKNSWASLVSSSKDVYRSLKFHVG